VRKFWEDDLHKNTRATYVTEGGEKGVYVSWTYSDKTPNEAIRGDTSGSFHPYPEEWGKGEWTAETTADAKQMAVDFASGVS
jgi:hypothetical protein